MQAALVAGLSVWALAVASTADGFVWRTELDGGSNRDDHAIAVAVDADGNVVAAGDANPTGDLTQIAVSKLDGASGAVLWQVGVAGSGNSFDSGAEAVAVDAGRDVYVAGTLDMQGSYQDFAVVRLDGDTGSALWETTLNGGPFDNERANAIALDRRGGVIAGGYIVRTGVQRFTVVKLTVATGAVVWRRELSGSLPFRTQANAVIVDSAGDVLAAGSIAHGGTAEDLAVVKLDGRTGSTLWQLDIDGAGHYQDEATDLALDSDGNAVVSGFIFGAQTIQDFAVVKVDADTGRVIWQRTLDGEAHWADIAEAVAVDSRDDVVAGGVIFRSGTFWGDFTVAKLDGATGEIQWVRGKGTEGTSTVHAVVVTSDDDVVAAGEIPKPATKTEFTVVRLDGATGRPLGGVSLNGTDNWFDVAFDVVVAGDAVVAAGWFVNRATGSDFAAVRLR